MRPETYFPKLIMSVSKPNILSRSSSSGGREFYFLNINKLGANIGAGFITRFWSSES